MPIIPLFRFSGSAAEFTFVTEQTPESIFTFTIVWDLGVLSIESTNLTDKG